MGYNSTKKTLNEPINTYSVARCIGATSADISTLCTSKELINKWAKYKPESNGVRVYGGEEFSLEQRQRNNFGLSLPTASQSACEVVNKIINNEDDGWEYKAIPLNQYKNIADFLHPDGTEAEPKDGYYHNAFAPIQGIMVDGQMYDYDENDSAFSLSLIANETELTLGLACPTSGSNVDTKESVYITLQDLSATIDDVPLKECYYTLVYGNSLKGYFEVDGAISSQSPTFLGSGTIEGGGIIKLKTGNMLEGIPSNNAIYQLYLLGSTQQVNINSTSGDINVVGNKFFRLPFASTKRMQGNMYVMTAPPISIQWLSVAFDVNGTLYGAGVSGADLSTNGDVYLVGVFKNESSSAITLDSWFNLSASRNFVSESNGTGKHPATTYVYNGSDLTIDSLKKDITSYKGNWVNSGNSLSFVGGESKVLMVGVKNLLLYNQNEQGAIELPVRPSNPDYMSAKNIQFSLSYRGTAYNGDWRIAPARKIGYNN